MKNSMVVVKKHYQRILGFIRSNKSLVLGLLFAGVLGDIFYIPASSDVRFFGLIGIYALGTRWYRLTSKVTFIICLALLGVMYVLFLTTSTSVRTERAAVWLVLFWIAGVIQQWREIK